MKQGPMYLKTGLTLLALISLLFVSKAAGAQSAPAQSAPTTTQSAPTQSTQPASTQDNRNSQDRDRYAQDQDQDRDRDNRNINRDELARFHQFLDSHPESAEQIRKDPSLVNKDDFVKNHPALQSFLQEHPGIREQFKENPNGFVQAENRFDRNRQEFDRFNEFLDSHRETADRLREDPSRANNQEFLKNHPEFQTFLNDHPGVRDRLQQDPNGFVQAENRQGNGNDASGNRVAYSARDTDANRDRDVDANRDRDANANRDRDAARDRDNDPNRRELANFNRFLDSHPETAERLRKDPSVVDNRDFVKNHPALQTYLQDHPEVRDQIRSNPNEFMQAENRFDRRENGSNNDYRDRHDDVMDRDTMHRHFGEFLGNHSEIAQHLADKPSDVNNHDYVESHPELKQYLNDHPEVQKEMTANPQSFVKSSQQYGASTNGTTSTGTSSKTVKPPAATAPKPY